jgi:DNA-binding PucR family transcriptional regulator
VRASALPRTADALDTEQHLTALVLGADPEALADLRQRALTPLAGLRPATAERLAETLRSWLLHQGRREEVAVDLVVHPQTVRYRMTQLRELYGDRLTDPAVVLELTVALALDA